MLEGKYTCLFITWCFSTHTIITGHRCAFFAFPYPTVINHTLTVNENTNVNFSFILNSRNCVNLTQFVIEISRLNLKVGVHTTQCQIVLKDQQCFVDEVYSRTCTCDSPQGPYRFTKVFSESDSTQWMWSIKGMNVHDVIKVNVTRSTPVPVNVSWEINVALILTVIVVILAAVVIIVTRRKGRKLKSAICFWHCKLKSRDSDSGNDDNQPSTSHDTKPPIDVGSRPDQIDTKSVDRGTDVQSFYRADESNNNVERVPVRRTSNKALQTWFPHSSARETPLTRDRSGQTHSGRDVKWNQRRYSRLQRASRVVQHLYDRFSRYRSSAYASYIVTASDSPNALHHTGSLSSSTIRSVLHRGSDIASCRDSSST